MFPVKKIVGFGVGVTGFLAAALALYQWSQAPPSIDEIWFVERDASSHPHIVNNALDVRALIEDEIVISGRITVPEEFVLVANKLLFADDGAILAPAGGKLLIVAKEIYQGLATTNGNNGDSPKISGANGGNGSDAGTVTLVAGLLSGFTVQALGGSGGDGASGANGANGRDGRCDGFGRWRKANPGGNGQNGGDAGKGGKGGAVTIYGPDDLDIEPLVQGGAPGNPGQGGRGGTGGRGCSGLGGSQASRAAGMNGSPGAQSRPGDHGVTHQPNVPFHEIAKRLRSAVANGTVSYQALLAIIQGDRRAGFGQ